MSCETDVDAVMVSVLRSRFPHEESHGLHTVARNKNPVASAYPTMSAETLSTSRMLDDIYLVGRVGMSYIIDVKSKKFIEPPYLYKSRTVSSTAKMIPAMAAEDIVLCIGLIINNVIQTK